MSVTTRTNRATNPAAASTTNWSPAAGNGGTASLSNQTSGGAYGSTFNRVTWSVGTSAVGGGFTYLQTGLAANTMYSIQVWVRCSKGQSVTLTAAFQNSGGTTVNTVVSAAVVVGSGGWTQVSLTGTSGAAVTQVNLVLSAATGSGIVWTGGDTLDGDAILIEASPTVGTYFDGSFVSAANVVYAWTGTANASTSTAITYQPVISVVAKTDAPCPRVEVTIQDLAPSAATVNVWRTADGARRAVRGARNRAVTGSDAVIDYEAPLGRSLSYDLEVLTGINTQSPVTTATVTVNSDTWWIQDPLVPSSAIPLNVARKDSTAPYLAAAAAKSLEYGASVTLIPILGSTDPVALMGNRSIAGNVSFDMFTNLASVTTQLRNLIQQTPLLLVRSTGLRNDGIPGLAYFSSAKPVEQPMTVAFGGTLTHWQLSGDLVAPPTMNVLIPIWTYGTVAALWATYQQAQTVLASKTYLDVLKSPSGV